MTTQFIAPACNVKTYQFSIYFSKICQTDTTTTGLKLGNSLYQSNGVHLKKFMSKIGNTGSRTFDLLV